MKVLEEDDRRTLTVCLDRSPSMATGEPFRYRGAQRLAAILGGLALVQLDGLSLVVGKRRVHTLSGAGSVGRLLDILQHLDTGPQDAFDLLRVPVERGWPGAVVWISDFADPEEASRPSHWLRRHGRRCTGWLPSVPEDRAPAARGWVRFRDPETGERTRSRSTRICARQWSRSSGSWRVTGLGVRARGLSAGGDSRCPRRATSGCRRGLRGHGSPDSDRSAAALVAVDAAGAVLALAAAPPAPADRDSASRAVDEGPHAPAAQADPVPLAPLPAAGGGVLRRGAGAVPAAPGCSGGAPLAGRAARHVGQPGGARRRLDPGRKRFWRPGCARSPTTSRSGSRCAAKPRESWPRTATAAGRSARRPGRDRRRRPGRDGGAARRGRR